MPLSSSVARDQVIGVADAAAQQFKDLALRIHANPEVGLEEERAASWIADALQAHGFLVTRGVADLPTAFVAARGQPGGRPVIAFLAEYDALPELGHACGHNLIAAAACLAAAALSQAIQPDAAQVRVIGCPAEESYAGKAQLVDGGVFGDVDVSLMAHAYHANLAARPASGRKSVVIEFSGRPAHAAAAPELGVNALDAIILTFSAVGLMRQQLRGDARVHGIITHGGTAANIIPDYTRAEFYVHSFDVAYLDEVERRLLDCARGAAAATGAELRASSAGLPMLPVLTNQALNRLYERNLQSLGEQVDIEPSGAAGSTDFGNVSRLMPALHAYFRATGGDVRVHTRPFADVAASGEGLAGMVVAAKALALTALDLIQQPELLVAARREFETQQAQKGMLP